MLIRNTRSFPPKFIITGADSLGCPEAQHQHTYPTGCQQISNLFFFPSPLSFNVPLNSTTDLTVKAEPSSSQSWTSYLLCSLTDRFSALCFIYREGRCSTVPYLGSHGPLCLQLLLQLLNTSLKREKVTMDFSQMARGTTVCFHWNITYDWDTWSWAVILWFHSAYIILTENKWGVTSRVFAISGQRLCVVRLFHALCLL